MRLWQGVALTAAVVASVASLWWVRDVSAQQNAQTGPIVASQPMPGPQPPFGPPVGPAPSQPPMPGQPPMPVGPMPPFVSPPAPPVAIAANADFVYVVWGNMLLQFDAKNLKLLRRVPLRGEFPREPVLPEKRQRDKEQPKTER
jgi:hypothetical protein